MYECTLGFSDNGSEPAPPRLSGECRRGSRRTASRIPSLEERSRYSEIAGARAGHASTCDFLVHLDELQVAFQFLNL